MFREQSHPGRCIVAYKDHVSEIVDISQEERAARSRSGSAIRSCGRAVMIFSANGTGYPELSFHGTRAWDLHADREGLCFAYMYAEARNRFGTARDA